MIDLAEFKICCSRPCAAPPVRFTSLLSVWLTRKGFDIPEAEFCSEAACNHTWFVYLKEDVVSVGVGGRCWLAQADKAVRTRQHNCSRAETCKPAQPMLQLDTNSTRRVSWRRGRLGVLVVGPSPSFFMPLWLYMSLSATSSTSVTTAARPDSMYSVSLSLIEPPSFVLSAHPSP
jgi:hypothetical protein